MVIIYDNYNTREVVDLVTNESHRDATVYCTAAEFEDIPKESLDEGTKLYISDWKLLDDTLKDGFGSRIHMLDKDKRWLPL